MSGMNREKLEKSLIEDRNLQKNKTSWTAPIMPGKTKKHVL